LRAESLTSKLNSLGQTLGLQPAAGRLSLVPGQPLAMQQAGWSEGVVDKVMWMSSQNLKSAEIQLEPADLGRLEVRVDISKDQTVVAFVSPHASVRDALESQMQRLRDLFTDQGMASPNVNVSDQSSGRGAQEQASADSGARRSGTEVGGAASANDEHNAALTMTHTSSVVTSRSLVDYYA
jgi:flagellar hook-length control protein FliK